MSTGLLWKQHEVDLCPRVFIETALIESTSTSSLCEQNNLIYLYWVIIETA